MLDRDGNYICISKLSEDNCKKWKNFLKDKNKNYSEIEGLWRRTQDIKNKENSGYKSKQDKRRKILHYINRYKINKNSQMILSDAYLWVSLAFPKNEIQDFLKQIDLGLKKGKWKKMGKNYEKGKLIFKYEIKDKYKEDIKEKRIFPKNYNFLDICLKTKSMEISKSKYKNPWNVLKTGIREKDIRQNPRIIEDIKEIKNFLPAQIEIECGPSIECGISPLHYLHEVYNISNKKTGKFILNPKEDTFIRSILSDPYKFFKKSTKMYKKLVLAKPNSSYLSIKKLFDKELFVGEILTNNFDRVPSTLKLKEKYLRKYEETHIIPKIKFHKNAKSLIVIGVHADRRKVQAAARKQGLKIIYIDPEGYMEKLRWRKYLMESPQKNDIVINKRACDVLPKLVRELQNT
ncbi:MAG: hypothetical protein V1888_02760 [archaeon]